MTQKTNIGDCQELGEIEDEGRSYSRVRDFTVDDRNVLELDRGGGFAQHSIKCY